MGDSGSRVSRGAFAVGAGIFCSRIAGLLRGALLGSVFGVGPHADVLSAALRLPNLLQNLLGEQTLSASFIPIYSRLLGEGRRAEAARFAGAIFALLAAIAGGLALLGVLFARPIVALFATGFLRDRELVEQGLIGVDRFPLAVAAVQWIFPMTALLVLSAWALGVLNSHGRFFLSYVAPVVWNGAIVAAVVWAAQSGGANDPARLLRAACAGALLGGALQFLIQLPGVIREIDAWTLRFQFRSPPVREAIGAFLPTVAGRGVVQLSSYLDQILASLLSAGAVAALGYAQTLYLLPVSLFGLSLAAAALPDLARRRGAGDSADFAAQLRETLVRVSFLNLPSTVAYLLLGLPIVDGIYRMFGGRFGAEESWLVYLTLAAYALGLPAATQARLLQTGLYSRGDARSPAKWALLRVSVALAVGVPAMLLLDRLTVGELRGLFGSMESPPEAGALRAGAIGLAIAASIAAWVELAALKRSVQSRLGALESTAREQFRFLGFALLSSLIPGAALLLGVAADWNPTLRAVLFVAAFGLTYLALARDEEPLRAISARLRRRS